MALSVRGRTSQQRFKRANVQRALTSRSRDEGAAHQAVGDGDDARVASGAERAAAGEHELLAHRDAEAVGPAQAGAAFGDVPGLAEHEGVAGHHDAGWLLGDLTGVTPALWPCEAPTHRCHTPLGTRLARQHVYALYLK